MNDPVDTCLALYARLAREVRDGDAGSDFEREMRGLRILDLQKTILKYVTEAFLEPLVLFAVFLLRACDLAPHHGHLALAVLGVGVDEGGVQVELRVVGRGRGRVWKSDSNGGAALAWRHSLDVQKFFGRPKIVWTSKNVFGRPKFFWTSNKFFGRPTNFFAAAGSGQRTAAAAVAAAAAAD